MSNTSPALMVLTEPDATATDDNGLRLRQWRAPDAARLREICADPDIRQFTSAPRLTDLVEARAWIETQRDRAARGEALFLAIVPDPDDVPVGSVHVLHVDYPNAKAELGYWIDPSARHKGLAVNALRQLSRWCFAQFKMNRLELFMSPDNLASQSVAKRAGYTYEGLLRSFRIYESRPLDLLSFGLLVSDPS